MQGQWEVGSCQDYVQSITGQGEGKPERKRDLQAKAAVGIYNITQGGLWQGGLIRVIRTNQFMVFGVPLSYS